MHSYKLERVQKTELTGKRLIRRRRSTLDCSAIKEDEEEDIKVEHRVKNWYQQPRLEGPE
jgi:hypothetical protein